MKTCSVCNQYFEDSHQFCPADGSPLIDVERTAPTETGVRYCPACATEYPLTFPVCPVDGLRLTRERPVFSRPVMPQPVAAAPTRVLEAETPPAADSLEVNTATAGSSGQIAAHWGESLEDDFESPAPGDGPEENPFQENLFQENRSQPGFRLAAIIITAGLLLFALATLYTFYSGGLRRPPAAKSLPAADQKPAPQESSPFVPTPEQASVYSEPLAEPAVVEPAVAEPAVSADLDIKKEAPKTAPPEPATAGRAKAAPTPHATSGVAVQPPAPRLVDVSKPVPSQATGGRVNARLIRLRARRTASGYRYDLTFNIQEQTGRSMRWNRLSISTVSATGATNQQTVPFSHYLGASGLLTFTVGVEMGGAGEDSWRGRVICTALGLDEAGRPLRATFGATVAP